MKFIKIGYKYVNADAIAYVGSTYEGNRGIIYFIGGEVLKMELSFEQVVDAINSFKEEKQ